MSNEDIQERRNQLIVLAVIVVIGAVLRLVNLGYESMWYDEILITNNARTAGSVAELLRGVERYRGGAPLHDLVLAPWMRVGTSDFMARFPSVVAGVASIVAVFFLGRRIFDGNVGLLAAMLLTLSRFHIRYSQEARFYAIFVLLAICSIIALLRYIERRTPGRWVVLIVTHTLCLYSAYFTAFLMAFEGLYATYLLVRSRLSKTTSSLMTWRTYLSLGAGMSLVVVLFLPWFFYAVLNEPTAGEEHTALNWNWILSVLRPLSAGSRLSVIVFVLAFMVGVVYCVRSRTHEAVLLVAVSVLSPVAALALVNKSGYFFGSRQILFALPSFLLVVAAGIFALAQLLDRVVARLAGRTCAWAYASTIALAVFVPLDAIDLAQYYTSHRIDWKRAAAYLDGNTGTDSLVIVPRWVQNGPFCLRYYAGQELGKRIFSVVGLMEFYDRGNDSLAGMTTPPMVWFVSPGLPDLDPATYDVVRFSGLKIARRLRDPESWQDFWGVIAGHMGQASTAGERYRGKILRELAEMLSTRQKNMLAYAVWKAFAREFPERPSHQRYLGELALKAGDLAAAEEAFRLTLKADPKNYAFSMLADLAQGSGRFDEAVEVVKNAIAAKDEPYRRTWLAMVYDKAGRNDLAEEQFHKAIAMQPDYPYAHFRFGQFCEANDRLDEAFAEYRTVLDLDPKNNAFIQLSELLRRTGRSGEAVEVVREAVTARDEPYRRVCLGAAYSAIGKYDLAEEQFLIATAMQPDYEYAHYRLGEFYAMHGRRDEAVAEFETVLRLVSPDSRRAKSVRNQIEKLTESDSATK